MFFSHRHNRWRQFNGNWIVIAWHRVKCVKIDHHINRDKMPRNANVSISLRTMQTIKRTFSSVFLAKCIVRFVSSWDSTFDFCPFVCRVVWLPIVCEFYSKCHRCDAVVSITTCVWPMFHSFLLHFVLNSRCQSEVVHVWWLNSSRFSNRVGATSLNERMFIKSFILSTLILDDYLLPIIRLFVTHLSLVFGVIHLA